jgi:hypothetical protein
MRGAAVEDDPLSGKIVCSPAEAFRAIDCKPTKGYGLIKSGELETFLDNRNRKVVVRSVYGYIERRRTGIRRKPATYVAESTSAA